MNKNGLVFFDDLIDGRNACCSLRRTRLEYSSSLQTTPNNSQNVRISKHHPLTEVHNKNYSSHSCPRFLSFICSDQDESSRRALISRGISSITANKTKTMGVMKVQSYFEWYDYMRMMNE